ncbi:MAG: ABC transporter ATP-binding protein [Chloroflexota bacterium]|jgi:ABC-2 type transport system ATP-binding protein
MIEFHNVRKTYGNFVALDTLTCTIPRGATVGLIGPNGAGKTTTMRMLTTLTPLTSGDMLIDGVSVTQRPDLVRQRIGFMPDVFGVYETMTAYEYLDFYARCNNVPAATRTTLIDDMLALVDLSHKKDAHVMSLSRGMTQRLSLARSLLHDPDILVLDEPASGLDPRARVELRALLNELRNQGKTILISSHILSDLADLCTHLLILERGTLVAFDTLENLLNRQSQRRIVVHTLAPSTELASIAQRHDYTCRSDDEQPLRYVLTGTGDDATQAALLADCIRAGVPIHSFASEQKSLERTFLQVTEGVI